MDILYGNINSFFEGLLSDLKCRNDTKAYIISIYGKYKTSNQDLSKDNITLQFSQARNKQDFSAYQNLGDWLFYIKSMFPESLKNASENYYDNIAQLSYYNCYRIVKTWKIYEQLADEYPVLTRETRNIFIKNNIIDHW